VKWSGGGDEKNPPEELCTSWGRFNTPQKKYLARGVLAHGIKQDTVAFVGEGRVFANGLSSTAGRKGERFVQTREGGRKKGTYSYGGMT